MASLLLNSLNDACQAHRHVVFNKDLNDGHGGFERAGKRHAIALFFGATSAKEKNQLTLMKIAGMMMILFPVVLLAKEK